MALAASKLLQPRVIVRSKDRQGKRKGRTKDTHRNHPIAKPEHRLSSRRPVVDGARVREGWLPPDDGTIRRNGRNVFIFIFITMQASISPPESCLSAEPGNCGKRTSGTRVSVLLTKTGAFVSRARNAKQHLNR